MEYIDLRVYQVVTEDYKKKKKNKIFGSLLAQFY